MNNEKCLALFDVRIEEILESDNFKVAHDKEELSSTLKCRCLLKQWFEDRKKTPDETPDEIQPPSEFEKIILDIEDEMAATKKYLDMYTYTGDVDLKTMAQEESRHAAKLINLGTSKAISSPEKTKLAQMNAKYQLLTQKLV